MIFSRKFKVWLMSFAFVVAVFVIYVATSETGNMRVDETHLILADSNEMVADSNAGQIGDARLQYLSEARFETINEKTRKLKRVVGFEKVLHTSGNEWELQKPFMTIYEDNLTCQIDSDTGMIEIENVKGSQPTPKHALLKGNVVIHISPVGKDASEDSYIFLDEVTFDGDRSRFTSASDILLQSRQAELKGKGLEVVYNGLTSQLDYFEIESVEYLHIKELNPDGSGNTTTSVVDETPVVASEPAEQNTVIAVEPVQLAQPIQAEIVAAEPKTVEDDKENYQCIFRDNVVLEYEDKQVVMTEELIISNLLWTDSGKDSKEDKAPPIASSNDINSPVIANNVVETQTPQPSANANTPVSQPVIDENAKVVAVVTCDGPIIIKPKRVKGDKFKPAKFKTYYELSDDAKKFIANRDVMIAEKIDYNYPTKVAQAIGKVELTFYPNSNSVASDNPVTLNAKAGAKFITQTNQAVFNGDVTGTLIEEKGGYEEKKIFYGQQLTVDLESKSSGAVEGEFSSGVAHISITGPAVRLESFKTANGVDLSKVRLTSKRIDYNKASDEIIASGKGRIEYSSKGKISAKGKTEQPCYALVEGFDQLIWKAQAKHVTATSEGTHGVHIGYLPIENGTRGKKITVDTKQIDIDYSESPSKRAVLEKLTAIGGVVYYEENTYEFAGSDLTYNAKDSFMVINGSEKMPCMFNGAFVDGIQYDINTGRAETVLSEGIGVIPAGR